MVQTHQLIEGDDQGKTLLNIYPITDIEKTTPSFDEVRYHDSHLYVSHFIGPLRHPWCIFDCKMTSTIFINFTHS